MLQSMTAYGQSLGSTKQGDLSWEIRSYNHRYLDIAVRVPEPLRGIDCKVREMVSARIHRGKVEAILKLGESTDEQARWVVNHELLAQLANAIGELKSAGIDTTHTDAVALLRWPGVVMTESVADDTLVQQAIGAFSQALDDFTCTRQREGEQIVTMLSSRAQQLSAHVATLRTLRPGVVIRQRDKLLTRLAQLEHKHDAGRLEQELVYAAQRLDIDEELDRLSAHLEEFVRIISRKDAVGRRLDFLMQEFNREANTIASKASDAETSAITIDMKVLIEQMREQVQNVE